MMTTKHLQQLIVPAAIGILSTIALAAAGWWSAQKQQSAALDSAAKVQARAINSAFSTELDFLSLVGVYFKSSADINEDNFNYLVSRLRAERPAVQSVVWLPSPYDAEKNTIETSQRLTHAEFAAYSAGGHVTRTKLGAPRYLSTTIIHSPAAEQNTELDFASETRFLDAMARARDRGEIATSSSLNTLNTSASHANIIAFAPFYDGTPITTQARRSALRGYFVATISVDSLMQAALENMDTEYIELDLLAMRDGRFPTLVYGPNKVNAHNNFNGPRTMLSVFKKLPEHWQIEVRPGLRFDSTEPLSAFIIITLLGLLGTLLVVHHKHVIDNRSELIRDLVDKRTRQLQQTTEMLEANSRTDALTGVYNRRYLNQELEHEWQRSVRDGSSMAIAIIDLDHFKAFNDYYGMPLGDQALAAVGNLLAANFHHPGELIARYDGQSFIAVMPSSEGAVTHFRNLIAAFEQLDIAHARSKTAAHLTVSVGLALCEPKSGDSLPAAVLRAERALFVAKNAGRNRLEYWTQAQERLNRPVLAYCG